MKGKIERKEPKSRFVPFSINIEVESIEEARLLYHCFNRSNLKNILFGIPDGKFYSRVEYSDNVSSNLDCNLYNELRKEIEEQGFDL